ncbi:MAG: T9SS type A sorting domain-containing protein [Chitinophagales bacterium]|nr:T9SS type A sorting domain-containing protein [Chitinophagales bacterium]
MQGNLLVIEEINHFEEIFLGKDLPAGVYLLQMITAEKNSSVRIVKIN